MKRPNGGLPLEALSQSNGRLNHARVIVSPRRSQELAAGLSGLRGVSIYVCHGELRRPLNGGVLRRALLTAVRIWRARGLTSSFKVVQAWGLHVRPAETRCAAVHANTCNWLALSVSTNDFFTDLLEGRDHSRRFKA